jgi:hypothetical protein
MRLPVERDWRVSSHASVLIASGPPFFPLLLGGPPVFRRRNAMPTIAHWLIIGAIIIGTAIILAFALHVSLLR